MAEFSIESLDETVKGMYGGNPKVAPPADYKSSWYGKNPQYQPTPTQSQDIGFDFHPSSLDEQVYQTYKQPAPVAPQGAIGSAFSKFGQGLASLADVTVGGIIPAIAGSATYAGARALQKTPAEAEALQQQVTGATEKPFGRAFGVTESAGYKNEASQKLMEYIGKHINESAETISKHTGIPAPDIQNMIGSLTIAIPELAKTKAAQSIIQPIAQEAKIAGEAVRTAAQPLQEAFQNIKQKIPSVRMEPVQAVEEHPIRQNIEQLQQNFEAKKAAPEPAPVAQSEPLGTATPVETAAPFKELSYAEKGLPLEEQFSRAKSIEKVMGKDFQVDLSAIEGKGKERATNFQTAKTDTPLGNFLTEKIADEKARLSNFSKQQVENTGGTLGLDESSNYKRGNTQLAPFEALIEHYDSEIEKLYKERDKTAQEVPVRTNFTSDLLKDKSITKLGDNEKLAEAADDKMKKLGMMDEQGQLLDVTAHTAEQFRKWLNEPNVWTPQNAGMHRALKDSIDADVFAHADQDIYKAARDLFIEKKNTLDNPKGISKILNASGPNGINRIVPAEKVSQTIAAQPVDQFTHIIDTLDKMPEKLQPMAQKAKAEIKAEFANQIHKIVNDPGANTAKNLTTYLNANQEVMSRLFKPDEISNFRDLHNVAHIIKTDVGYPGAGAQTINLEKKLGRKIAEQLVSKGAAGAAEMATGGVGMGIPAVVTNAAIERSFAKRDVSAQMAAEKQAMTTAQKRFSKISELLHPENVNRVDLRGMANKE